MIVGAHRSGFSQRRIPFGLPVIERAITWLRPRPGAGFVRTTARIVMLYLARGMPAREMLRIMWQMPSISRARSGLLPSITFLIPLLALDAPRWRVRASTDHFSSSVFE